MIQEELKNENGWINIPKTTNSVLIPREHNGDTIFFINGEKNEHILRLCNNGDIFVKGRLAENDKEVVNALREFLKSQLFLR